MNFKHSAISPDPQCIHVLNFKNQRLNYSTNFPARFFSGEGGGGGDCVVRSCSES